MKKPTGLPTGRGSVGANTGKKILPDPKKLERDQYQVYPKPTEEAEFQHCQRVLNEVHVERMRQNDMWGQQDHEDGDWRFILDEELGEAGRERLHERFLQDAAAPAKKREELVQCAAVLVAWIQTLDRQKQHRSRQPKGGEGP